jgi:hypothetical protein
MLNLLVTWQEFFKIERSPNFTDAFTGIARSGNVVQEIIQEIGNRVIVECFDPFIDHHFHLPIGLSQQTL